MTIPRFWTEKRTVAVLSLVATYLFFYEYLPPFLRVHLFSDIQGYHYPLLQYALQSLKAGRLPEWDPTIYCGLSFAGNVQAALFYPPNWLLFAANLGRRHLSYKSLEILVIAHLWLAFFLCYLWLRGKRLGALAGVLGASVFAYSGYMMSQANHVGVVTGYAWMPLGLWGIDQAVASRDWRPLWKVVAASALCFLAGYPPTWVVFCVCMVVYAATSGGHWRAVLGTVLALAASLLVVMVQLLPAREAAALKAFEPKYGSGVREIEFYVSYFIPNYFDFGRHPYGWGHPPGQYLYLGAPGLFGLLWLARRRNLRAHFPALAIAGVCLVGLTNPFNLVWTFLSHVPLLAQMCHSFNFLEGLTLAAALLAAVSLDDFLKRASREAPRWLAALAVGLLAAWSLRQLWISLPGGPDFSSGWRSALEPTVMLALFFLCLYTLRAEHGVRRAWLTAALLVAVWADYKVFGASRGFNADGGDVDQLYSGDPLPGVDNLVYQQLRANSEFRVALDENHSHHPTDLRHFGLTTPQGFDPFVPAQYRKAIEATNPFRTHHLFYINPTNEALLRLLGVRYFMTTERSPTCQALLANSSFRLLRPSQSFFNVFEYLKAQPPYYWEAGNDPIERTLWAPEKREFRARSARGGRFVLVEQFFPGWRATVDHRPAPIERWGQAFQSVEVGPGEHQIEFKFRSPGLRAGALVSVASLVGLLILVRKK